MMCKQCLMMRKIDDKEILMTSWIPEKFAIKDSIIKLQDRETKKWTDGWKVVIVGTKRKQREVIERSQDYKNQRKASDI